MLFITFSVYYISVTKMFEQNLKKIVLVTLCFTYDKIVKKKFYSKNLNPGLKG